MNTFKHSRTHDGLLATAIAIGALGLALVSPGALAMTTEHDLDREDDGFNDQIGFIIEDARGVVVTENPDFVHRTATADEELIGGKVGPLPRPKSSK